METHRPARNITADISPVGFEPSDGRLEDTAEDANRVVRC
jgi:hypothetical protein